MKIPTDAFGSATRITAPVKTETAGIALREDHVDDRHRADGSARRAALDRAGAHRQRPQPVGRAAAVAGTTCECGRRSAPQRARAAPRLLSFPLVLRRIGLRPPGPRSASTPAIPRVPFIEVRGLSRGDLSRLASANLTPDEWSAILRVSVRTAHRLLQAICPHGRTIHDGRDAPVLAVLPARSGREYDVRFQPANVARRVSIARRPSPERCRFPGVH